MCNVGHDDDNDGTPDGGDCAPFVNSVSQPAGDVGASVRFGADKITLSWLKATDSNVHNVYRGSQSAGVPFAYNHSCFAIEVFFEATDTAEPATGALSYYLVGGTNVCGGDGSLGTDSGAIERPNDTQCVAQGNDTDMDDVPDINDNCPQNGNPAQLDDDLDGRGNACDNCPAVPNTEQSDFDADSIGDACDTCTDTDGDSFGNPGFGANTCQDDNCPTDANPGQLDDDNDGTGNACDVCVADPDDDIDGDGFCADLDNCPTLFNPLQSDGDVDGVAPACAVCWARIPR